MKKVDKIIPLAIQAINDQKIPGTDNKIPNEFKGYVDSFGASIVQNGLIPAVIFSETGSPDNPDESYTTDPERKDTHKKRNKLILAILQVLYSMENNPTNKETNLYNYINKKREQGIEIKKIRNNIVDAAIAVKLAMRTFAFGGDE